MGPCYRKVCHLLTDMDEWGQVVVIDALMQYCRAFFKQPRGHKTGSAEKVDLERRVTRSTKHIGPSRASILANERGIFSVDASKKDDILLSLDATAPTNTNGLPAPSLTQRQRQK